MSLTVYVVRYNDGECCCSTALLGVYRCGDQVEEAIAKHLAAIAKKAEEGGYRSSRLPTNEDDYYIDRVGVE